MLTWMDEALSTLEDKTLRRTLRISDPALVNFGSNDYLGLARHPVVLAGAREALQTWGAGAASSRLLSGHLPPHAELEAALASWLQQEAALTFPAGYMANLGVLTALARAGDAVILDRLCHASLIDAARLSGARLLVYRHGDAEDAARVLERAQRFRRRVLVTESLFSMDGDIPPLKELRAAAARYGALAVVDEAHALGVFGENGRGLSDGWDVVLGTLSKALGSQGGFAAASRQVIDYLVNTSRPFIFTTGLSPVCAGAARAALRVLQTAPALADTVRARAQRLRAGLIRLKWATASQTHVLPLIIGAADAALRLAETLRARGFYVPAVRPPAVHAGQCRLRLSVTAEHTEAEIDRLLDALGDAHE